MHQVPRRWSPDAVAAPLGRYSHLVEAPAGHRLVFISGQIGNTRNGELAGDDVESQTSQALRNIEDLLAAAGATPDHLIRMQSFVAGVEHLAGFRSALGATYDRWFPSDAPAPGHTLLVVAGLASPALRVEIEGWFTLPPDADRGGA